MSVSVVLHGGYGRRTAVGGELWCSVLVLDGRSSAVVAGVLLTLLPEIPPRENAKAGICCRHCDRIAARRFLRISVARDHDGDFRGAAIPAERSLEMPLTDHWKMYVGRFAAVAVIASR